MFKLEITSLSEFILFVKFIKGEDLTEEELQKITATIQMDTEKLKKAVESQRGEKNAKSSS